MADADLTLDGVVMGRADGSGSFRIERSGFRPPADRTVAVNDGTTPVDARLSGCITSTGTRSTTWARAVFDDGTVIIGTARNPQLNFEAFRATLPR